MQYELMKGVGRGTSLMFTETKQSLSRPPGLRKVIESYIWAMTSVESAAA